MDGTQPGYESMVISESHKLSEQGIVSEIRVHANITNDITYVCDVSVKDLTACKKTIPILFEGIHIITMWRPNTNGHYFADDISNERKVIFYVQAEI